MTSDSAELEQLRGQLARLRQQQSATADLLHTISSSGSGDAMLETLTQLARRLCRADQAQFYLADGEGQVRWPSGSLDRDGQGVDWERVPVDRNGKLGHALAVRVMVPASSTPPEAGLVSSAGPPSTATGQAPQCWLVVPVRNGEMWLGVLSLGRDSTVQFSAEEVLLAELVAAGAATALHLKQLTEDLQQRTAELGEATRHKNEFMATMSHELRTPLNAIIGYSEMLHEEAVERGDPDYAPDLEKINAAGKSLLALINDILDLTRIEAGSMELYPEPLAVPVLVQDVARLALPMIEKNGNTLELDCPPEAGDVIADGAKLRQILLNLLSNAAKFTDRGRISLSLRRETAGAGDRLVFTVADTGIGISAEQLDRLFEAFRQADASSTRRYGGTGLGLTISRQLCRLMGGDIEVKTEAGHGSSFTVTVPVTTVTLKPGNAQPREPEAISGQRAPLILVVDDDIAVRELLGRMLSREGYRIAMAGSGEDGLRLAETLRPAAITLDIMMPGLDGWQTLTRLKADPATAGIPVVVLTMLDDRELGFALGAQGFLTKPIEREALLSLLAAYGGEHEEPTVLLVEDDRSMRKLLRRALDDSGWRIQEAENGRVALELLASQPPSLILLDLMMPEMDGFELVERLRRHEQWRRIPVVVVTARDLSAIERRRVNGGVERVLQKAAYSRDELLAEVRRLIAAHAAPSPASAAAPGAAKAEDLG